MILECQFERANIGERFDRVSANSWIIDSSRRQRHCEPNHRIVFPVQTFIPHDQLESAVAALEEQLVNSVWLVDNLEIEPAGTAVSALIGQNGCKVVKVNRCLSW